MSYSQWYSNDEAEILSPAQEVFSAAVQIFNTQLTNDDRKRNLIQHAADLHDVERVVADAKKLYDQKHKKTKTRERLVKLSTRVRYYGNVLDVLASYNPEYLALAWGAMKFMLVAIINHDTMLSSLAKGLCQVAESLPHVELVTVLYPTASMKRLVAELYANIIRFLIRAKDWYQEGKLLHALHAITQPVELRYKDLLEDIKRCSENVDKLALAASQAEQRDMHSIIKELRGGQIQSDKTLLELKQMIITFRSLNESSMINTNNVLTDLQLSNILTFTMKIPFLDPDKTFRYNLFMRNRRRLKDMTSTTPFWLHKKLEAWEADNGSSLIMVKGSFKKRFEVRDFCVNIIEFLKAANVPVLWALKTSNEDQLQAPSTIDLLKHLTSQLLTINKAIQTERGMSFSCVKFQTAATVDEWFEILASVIIGLPRVYIIIDIEALSNLFSGGQSLPMAFLDLFKRLQDRGSNTVVKVVLVSYGSPIFNETVNGEYQDLILQVGRIKGPSKKQKNQRAMPFMLKARGNSRSVRGRIVPADRRG